MHRHLVTISMLAALLLFGPANSGRAEVCSCGLKFGSTCVPLPSCTTNDNFIKRFTDLPSPNLWADAMATIVNTGYKELPKLGGEEDGYGLYSYAIILSDSKRSKTFLNEVVQTTPPIEVFSGSKKNFNILYIPLAGAKENEFRKLKSAADGDRAKIAQALISSYDRSMALSILHRVCVSATGAMRELCISDFSDGPFIFTYERPVTTLVNVPPPFLIVDLRAVHEKAFRTFLAKYKEQVRTNDFADGKRLQSFKLTLLNITLTAADLIDPIKKSIADVILSVETTNKKP